MISPWKKGLVSYVTNPDLSGMEYTIQMDTGLKWFCRVRIWEEMPDVGYRCLLKKQIRWRKDMQKVYDEAKQDVDGFLRAGI